MNYQIIKDKDLFLKFLDWLPQLDKNEVFFGMLLSRSKYTDQSLPKTECCVKRFISTKEHLYDKVKQLECEIGLYKWNGIELPSESLVILLNPNPRNLKKSAKATLIELAKTIDENVNPSSIAMTCIQESIGTKHFVHLEYDNAAVEDFLAFAEPKINRNAMTVIRTKGGFHVLIQTRLIEMQYVKTWYQALISFKGIDVTKDMCVPIVGCQQSTFTPYFVE